MDEMGYLSAVRENSSGHKKKLLFFIERLEVFRKRRCLQAFEVKVLDVGCGNGIRMTLPIGEQGYSLTGIDFHKPSLKYANGANRLQNVKFVVQDVMSLSAIRSRYDVILFADILEHVENPRQLLMDARSILKPNGVILVCIPNGFGPYEVEDFLFRAGPLRALFMVSHLLLRLGRWMFGRKAKNYDPIPYNRESGHIQFFTMHKFRRLLYTSGYEMTAFQKGSFISGPFTHTIFKRSTLLLKLNLGCAKYLPAFMCSTWYFECRPINITYCSR